MRNIVMSGSYSLEEAETDRAHRITKHESAHPGRVALKSGGNHVEHQPHVFGVIRRLIVGYAFWIDLRARLPRSASLRARPLHPLFDRAHRFEVFVQPETVRSADLRAHAAC